MVYLQVWFIFLAKVLIILVSRTGGWSTKRRRSNYTPLFLVPLLTFWAIIRMWVNIFIFIVFGRIISKLFWLLVFSKFNICAKLFWFNECEPEEDNKSRLDVNQSIFFVNCINLFTRYNVKKFILCLVQRQRLLTVTLNTIFCSFRSVYSDGRKNCFT